MNNTFIDTHCHLDVLEDISLNITNAKKKGIFKIVNPATDSESSRNILELAQEFPEIFPSVGIHPIDSEDEKSWQELPVSEIKGVDEILQGHCCGLELYPVSQANHQQPPSVSSRTGQKQPDTGSYSNNNKKNPTSKIIAIGECGLDFKYAQTVKEKQIQIQLFKQHVQWSIKYNLPLIIHNRGAGKEIISIIVGVIHELSNFPNKNNNSISGVFHCFCSSKKLVKQIVDELPNFYFGIGGLVTFDTGLQQVVKNIPIEKIILETDSPYLTPKPVKDTNPWPNEPANTFYVAQKLAEIKELTLEQVAKITTNNAQQLFKI